MTTGRSNDWRDGRQPGDVLELETYWTWILDAVEPCMNYFTTRLGLLLRAIVVAVYMCVENKY